MIGLSRFLATPENISFDTNKLLQTFGFGTEPKIIWHNETVNNFIKFLETQYNIYDKYFIKRDKNEGYKFTTTSMLSITEDNVAHLKMLQSYMYVSRQPKDWLPKAFSLSDKILEESFINALENIDLDYYINKIPKKKEDISIEDINVGCSTHHYYFYRFDYMLYKWMLENDFTCEQSYLFKKFRFRKCKSVEHITPRTSEGSTANTTDINDFKNLALLSRGINSKLSNNPPEGKKAILEACGYCESLKMLFNLYLSDKKFDYLSSFNQNKVKLCEDNV